MSWFSLWFMHKPIGLDADRMLHFPQKKIEEEKGELMILKVCIRCYWKR